MQVVTLLARPRLRWLALSAIAALGAIAWHAHRAPAPPEPEIICAIPAIDPAPAPAPQRFAQPPPGDPRTMLVEAELIDRPATVGDCGDMLWETTMTFHALKSIGFSDLRVLVPCAEMTRAQFGGADAGNAGVLVKGGRYMLTIREATDVADGKNDTLWRAIRIDQR